MTNMNLTLFTDTNEYGDELVNILGGKGANLHRMATELQFPVPEGFTIPTAWTFKEHFDGEKAALHALLKGMVLNAMDLLNKETKLKFGDPKKPLLVSVRSGAPKSMPGMMETILNLGINDETVVGLAKQTNERFAWDSYRRFVQMYAVTALGMDPKLFAEHYEACKVFANTDQLDVNMLKLMVKQFKEVAAKEGHEIPADVHEQLYGAILAVLRSWNAPKAKSYRKIENISSTLGTAVNVQRMVFGNMNDQSGTGVAFTRDPNTGENVLYGDFLVNAQGEDVVDGSHITQPLASMGDVFPEQYKELTSYLDKLEETFKDMCDVEFTIEDGKLYILQTRVGKRNPTAAVQIAVDMLTDGMITKDECIERIQALKHAAALKDTSSFNGTLVGTGQGACPGLVLGTAVFSSDDAVTAQAEGKEVILITHETDPNDIEGMSAAVGILTAKGGLVSHAAVVARGWGKPCVVGCAALHITSMGASIAGKMISKGDLVCIDGKTGEVFVGA